MASIASLWVNPLDLAVDRKIENLARSRADGEGAISIRSLRGKAAIALAHEAYARFCDIFSRRGPSAPRSGKVFLQRLHWSNTDNRDPRYQDSRYAEALLGRATVMNLTPWTLTFLTDLPTLKPTLENKGGSTQSILAQLAGQGIELRSLEARIQEMWAEGLIACRERTIAHIHDRISHPQSGDREGPCARSGAMAEEVQDTLGGDGSPEGDSSPLG